MAAVPQKRKHWNLIEKIIIIIILLVLLSSSSYYYYYHHCYHRYLSSLISINANIFTTTFLKTFYVFLDVFYDHSFIANSKNFIFKQNFMHNAIRGLKMMVSIMVSMMWQGSWLYDISNLSIYMDSSSRHSLVAIKIAWTIPTR